MDRSKRVIELDALRGIGALAILAYHLWPSRFFLGWTRADMFFVISGYVITNILITQEFSCLFLFKFLARRALRLWPSYFLMLAILCVIAYLERRNVSLGGLLSHLTFTQNLPYYWSTTVPDFLDGAKPTWSLAIEEQFYLVWPLIIAVTGRSFLTPIAILLLANSVATRILGLHPVVALARCDGLVLGSILAVILEKRHTPNRRIDWLGVTLAIIGLASLYFLAGPATWLEAPAIRHSGCGPLSILAVNLFYFALIGVIVRYSMSPILVILRLRFLCYLGQISYGIYLYSFIINHGVENLVGARTLLTDVLSIVVSILTAALSWKFVERPIASMKKYICYDSNKMNIIKVSPGLTNSNFSATPGSVSAR